MLGPLPDFCFAAFEGKRGPFSDKIVHFHINDSGGDGERWVYFLPEIDWRLPYIRKPLLRGRNVDVYVLPRNPVKSDPLATKIILDRMLAEAKKRHAHDGLLNVLGVSLANVVAFRFAESVAVKRIVAVVPGSRLPECIWESLSTRNTAKGSGRPFADWKRVLEVYNPIDSLAKLSRHGAHCDIYLGASDRLIPYRRGKELADEMIRQGISVTVKTFALSGHGESIVRFAREFGKTS